MKLTFVLTSIKLTCPSLVFAQTPPANIDIGAADTSNEPWLGCVNAGGVQHLITLARTPYPKAGHRVPTDGGATWSGSDTVPGNGSNDKDPLPPSIPEFLRRSRPSAQTPPTEPCSRYPMMA
jgi:hypothetical protein